MKTKLLLLSVILLLSACSPIIKTQTAKTMHIYGGGVIQKPVVADLDVDENKVKGTATASGESVEAVKQQAIVSALKKANADVLVEPTFETEIKNGQITATVTGFPATYTNFRPIKEGDLELLKAGVIHRAEVYEPEQQKKKRGAGVFFGIPLGISAVVGILAAVL